MPTSPTIFVTGATGKLGHLVVDSLLDIVPAHTVVAGVRDPAKPEAAAIRDKSVGVRIADYDRPETLASAFAGVDRLLLISGSELGRRTAQHRNVIDAARQAGVSLIAYTSILHADTSPLSLAVEHRDTETALTDSGLPFVLLRNSWYNEVFTWRLPATLKLGTLIGAAGDGRISAAARADYARAAAVVLTEDGHAGRTYELAGDDAFSLAELAAMIAQASGKPIDYRNMTAAAFRTAAIAGGTPELFANILSNTDAGIQKGALFETGGALARLIGRPTTPLRTTIDAFVRQPVPASHA